MPSLSRHLGAPNRGIPALATPIPVIAQRAPGSPNHLGRAGITGSDGDIGITHDERAVDSSSLGRSANDVASPAWLLLIYTIPSEPSRLRATVWRALKRAGAVYLRDGVAVLPARPETAATFRAIAAQIEEFGGEATLVEDARLAAPRAAAIMASANTQREEEYAEVAREVERFLAHARRERQHRELTFAELEEIEADLGKLKRWFGQICDRDHFGAPSATRAGELVERCEAEMIELLDQAGAREREMLS